MSAPGRPASLGVVAVAGATGLVGRCLVQQLCADPAVTTVHALARRPLDVAHPKLVMHVVDFTALPALPALDAVFLALGTTIAYRPELCSPRKHSTLMVIDLKGDGSRTARHGMNNSRLNQLAAGHTQSREQSHRNNISSSNAPPVRE